MQEKINRLMLLFLSLFAAISCNTYHNPNINGEWYVLHIYNEKKDVLGNNVYNNDYFTVPAGGVVYLYIEGKYGNLYIDRNNPNKFVIEEFDYRKKHIKITSDNFKTLNGVFKIKIDTIEINRPDDYIKYQQINIKLDSPGKKIYIKKTIMKDPKQLFPI